MTRVLIVGGAGFVGSHLTELFLNRGSRVWVFDNFSTGHRDFLPIHDRLEVVEGDILDTDSLADILDASEPDILYHLAAIHHIPTCEKDPIQALRVNVEGTQSVLAACAARPVSHIMFASTGALYDPENSGALSESFATEARDIYSISKLAGERLIRHHVSIHGGQATIARLFNVVGRRETNPHVIPSIMAQLAEGQRNIRLGNLHPRRDYIHVEDVAEALRVLGASAQENPLEIYNVGSGREHSVKELVEFCAEAIGEPIAIISSTELRRRVDRPSQLADLTKIRSRTGWEPSRTLRLALGEIWDETLENGQHKAHHRAHQRAA